jgi:DNA-binding HxlR family transcriptional regulator
MQYLVLKHCSKRWKVLTIVRTLGKGQKSTFSLLKKEYKNLTGEYWILPIRHGSLHV